MFSRRQFRRERQHQQKSTSIFSSQIDAWKVRPIYGFEKHLFPNTETPFSNTFVRIKHKRTIAIDPARFIYPRDAMGALLTPLVNRNIPTRAPFYLPKDNCTKTRSPAWTIKHVHPSKAVAQQIRRQEFK